MYAKQILETLLLIAQNFKQILETLLLIAQNFTEPTQCPIGEIRSFGYEEDSYKVKNESEHDILCFEQENNLLCAQMNLIKSVFMLSAPNICTGRTE